MRAMAFKVRLGQGRTLFTTVLFLGYLSCKVMCETGDCRQQEFKDRSGNCVLCKQCGPGMELSKECGFGYGEDAQCVPCRPHRFKEDWGFQKCKPCVDCALVNRFQRANCSHTGDAVCGDCLPGFYRKTKLVGFQDMECVPCGDPPPPYDPHCTSKVNLVKISATASSPRDTALAAVICSALATVLLALLILCVIYCKRQFMEKKPSWSLRSQDIQYNGSELSCFDQPRLRPLRPTEHVVSVTGTQPRPMKWSFGRGRNASFLRSVSRSICGEFSDAWPLMQNPMGADSSFCDSYPELVGEDVDSLNPGNESSASLDSSGGQGLAGTAAPESSGNFSETTDSPRCSDAVWDPPLVQSAQRTPSQGGWEGSDTLTLATPTSFQDA